MSDVAVVAAFVKSTLIEISKQGHALGMGLQNVAPVTGTPNNSVQYLLESANHLSVLAKSCDEFLPTQAGTPNLTSK
ncbi:MAG: hypothetical protein A3F14_03445 [Gammaproteobacteria bacterium RIFCSPHIGHO2_12_FULL_43_28]|nr:MAG: hypothetical protein A3F14_03445 [Gammaproteobacteria bacterium RIFCSPHIGHO2_12_FULL_43_28]